MLIIAADKNILLCCFFFRFNSISKISLENYSNLKKKKERLLPEKDLDKEHLRPDCYYLQYIFNYFLQVTFGHCQTTY